MKKLLEERDNSRSDSETSSVSERDEQKHAAFRDKIVARDQRCVLTESKPTSCEAAHIIPWAFHRKNEALWWHLFEPHCFNPADAAFDVRNGLLLRDDLNELFGMYLFTIVASSDDGEYQVIVSDLDAQVLPNDLDNQITAELRGYNGKIITFVGNQNQWPALEFLKHHNDVFTFRQESRKASSNLLSRDTN
ncbi:hypothetical protein BJ741DRAFT_137269 [Chytriomyces cf. hyalinus JEL632]|nr:hypothetical protein BJ741DRAFT_137269 [Chytriomyces cf. hyalinus JEL632]